MIISVGFDGVCVTNDFPKMGKEVGAAEALRILQKRGHKIVLYTKRWNRTLADALKWFKDNGIKLHGLVAIPKKGSYSNLYDGLEAGIQADLYIDNRALGCPLIHGDHEKPYVDWVKAIGLLDLL